MKGQSGHERVQGVAEQSAATSESAAQSAALSPQSSLPPPLRCSSSIRTASLCLNSLFKIASRSRICSFKVEERCALQTAAETEDGGRVRQRLSVPSAPPLTSPRFVCLDWCRVQGRTRDNGQGSHLSTPTLGSGGARHSGEQGMWAPAGCSAPQADSFDWR